MPRKNQKFNGFDEETPEEEFVELDEEQFRVSLLKRRIVLLTGDITEKKVGDIKGSLVELSMASPKKNIILFINSDGGEIESGLFLYDFMTSFLKAPVIGVVGAQCVSMAPIVLQGCTKRIAAPHSIFSFHATRIETTIVYHPSMKDRMKKIKIYLAKNEQQSNKILEKHSKMPLSEIKRLSFVNNGDGTIFSAEEALKKGLIDEIAEGDEYKIF